MKLEADFPAGPERAEFMLVKAECLSTLGSLNEPEHILDDARAQLRPEHHATEILIIELERCKHYLRTGELDRAVTAARSLLRLGLRLHPIAQRIVQDFVVSLYQTEQHLTLHVLTATQRNLKFPRLMTS